MQQSATEKERGRSGQFTKRNYANSVNHTIYLLRSEENSAHESLANSELHNFCPNGGTDKHTPREEVQIVRNIPLHIVSCFSAILF